MRKYIYVANREKTKLMRIRVVSDRDIDLLYIQDGITKRVSTEDMDKWNSFVFSDKSIGKLCLMTYWERERATFEKEKNKAIKNYIKVSDIR